MPAARNINPFRFSGPLAPEQMIDRDRDPESHDLMALAEGSHSFRLVGPRRQARTTLLGRVLAATEQPRSATVLVNLQDVLSIAAHRTQVRTAEGAGAGRSTGPRSRFAAAMDLIRGA
jgi:hypothetical protein